jgi:hypothetical protein
VTGDQEREPASGAGAEAHSPQHVLPPSSLLTSSPGLTYGHRLQVRGTDPRKGTRGTWAPRSLCFRSLLKQI